MFEYKRRLHVQKNNQFFKNDAGMKIVVFVVLVTLAVCSAEKKRISRLKCEEYSQQTKKFACVSEAFPFVGATGLEDKEGKTEWICSGSLISDQFVLTTAHCASRPIKYVRFGESDFNHPSSNAKTYTISEVFRHPEYKKPSAYDDIALLKLDRAVQFTEYIRPACLYNSQNLSQQYIVAGHNFIAREEPRGLLVHEKNAVLSEEECKKKFEAIRKIKDGVNFQKQFCTKEGSISCEINSGGPILQKDEHLPCMHNIAGFVDIGKGICIDDSASLNVKVSGYIGWIESIVWPQSNLGPDDFVWT